MIGMFSKNSFKTIFKLVFISALLLSYAPLAATQTLPHPQDMEALIPLPTPRLRIYDRFYARLAQSATGSLQRYSHPEAIHDLEIRLERVRLSGQAEDVLTPEEQVQYQKNKLELQILESSFFDKWQLRNPMTLAIRFQKWLTQKNSPLPQGENYKKILHFLKTTAHENVLYKKWREDLPADLKISFGPVTWGELALKFNQDDEFRRQWVEFAPQSLPLLVEMFKVWSWEDSSVRSVTVVNAQTPLEYWILKKQDAATLPNRFQLIVDNDFEALMHLEFAPTVFFNRISKITSELGVVTYHLETIEKGRTMELSVDSQSQTVIKRTFPGAELLRKTKIDEFLQRDLVKKGQLNLFLGARTLQFDQIQELAKLHPALVLAVGHFGFSVTGGPAQTVSNRTDTPEEQLLKLTATLIDVIEFAQTKNVLSWFNRNAQYVQRTIMSGVGSGGSVPLSHPASTTLSSLSLEPNPSDGLSCKALF